MNQFPTLHFAAQRDQALEKENKKCPDDLAKNIIWWLIKNVIGVQGEAECNRIIEQKKQTDF